MDSRTAAHHSLDVLSITVFTDGLVPREYGKTPHRPRRKVIENFGQKYLVLQAPSS
ncbi:MAG: hypothetical protein U1U88_001778 [Lawsonella clevelandensis]